MTGDVMNTLRDREMEYGPLKPAAAEAEERPWRHWRLARDAQQVAWLFFDRPEAEVNLLSGQAVRELGEILAALLQDPPQGLVLRSAKPSGFCVGADIGEFVDLGAEEEIVAKLDAAHAIVDRLVTLPFPSVAVIHGLCLGGGLELALCCDYRLAVPGARLGLPEILLGLHPGLGGTARLTRLIDPVRAMELMLTGRTLEAARAWRYGLVDGVIPEQHLLQAIQAALQGNIGRQRSGLKGHLLGMRPARKIAARLLEAKSAAKAPPEHYPAPQALIELWREHGGRLGEMLGAEKSSFARLLSGPTAHNLIRVFFLRERLKKLSLASQPPVGRVQVIGAGAMGGDIAVWCAYKGLQVSLFDRQPQAVARAVATATALCRKKHLSSRATQQVLDRLVPDLHNRGAARADLVIEAVPEDIELKQQLYREIEPRLKQGALLASNTSCIPLQQLRKVLTDPGRFLGLHFFNPVARMQLVEIVRHDALDPAALERALAFVGQLDRLPVPVTGSPGFLVNRALTPYLLEAMLLMDEGLAAEAIDGAAIAFGMPVGPIELADRVGLDVCLSVAGLLRGQPGQNLPALPDWLQDKVTAGELGRKSGKGLYRWKKGRPLKSGKTPEAGGEILDRLLLPMLNACMACLREGVIEDEELLDAAMIFATGFAPFWGGPLHYARSRGFGEIEAGLHTLADLYGERFKPDPGWAQRTEPGSQENNCF